MVCLVGRSHPARLARLSITRFRRKVHRISFVHRNIWVLINKMTDSCQLSSQSHRARDHMGTGLGRPRITRWGHSALWKNIVPENIILDMAVIFLLR
jgi:hypothetical protein